MKIYINDNELDFTLENEKTCGDVLNQIQIQFEKDNATIIGINIDGKNISVEEIDSLSQVGIEDVEIIKIIAVSAEHIKETLIALSYNFDKINQGFEDFPVLLQGNDMVKVSEVLKNFADDFDLLCRTVSLTALFPEYFANIKIEENSLVDFIKEFSPFLEDFENAIKENDTVTIGDIAEYEIKPRLESYCNIMKEV
mgnify:FL=1